MLARSIEGRRSGVREGEGEGGKKTISLTADSVCAFQVNEVSDEYFARLHTVL